MEARIKVAVVDKDDCVIVIILIKAISLCMCNQDGLMWISELRSDIYIQVSNTA